MRRRGDLEPVAYIIGEREFFSLAFHVGPGVLVPRPETEHLVEVARELLAPVEAPLLADVGTGSGCVAVALLVELPRARAHATDRSRRALETARRNAERHGVLDRLALHEGDVLTPLEGGPAWGHLDLVVSNPPYVRRDDPAVDEGVRRHEPPEALFVSGEDPLEVARRVAAQAARALAPGGALALEVGAGSAAEATALLEAAGWAEIGVVPDLGGHDRIVHARQPA